MSHVQLHVCNQHTTLMQTRMQTQFLADVEYVSIIDVKFHSQLLLLSYVYAGVHVYIQPE